MVSMVVTPPRALFQESPEDLAQAEERDREAQDLLKHLKRQQRNKEREAQALSAVPTPPREKVAFAGDRGLLSPDMVHSPYPQPQGLSDHSGGHPGSPGDLKRQLNDVSVEVQALRAETKARTDEATTLRQKLRSAELSLKQASAVVSTWSTKVEAVSSSRHSVLEASAMHIDSHASAMRERLARMEYEFAEKDKEVEILRRAVQSGSGRLEQQRAHVHGLRKRHEDNLMQMTAFEDDLHRINRQRDMDDWHHQIRNNVETREGHDVPLAMAREEKREQIAALDEEMSTLRAFINNLEAKCNRHAQGGGQLQTALQDLQNQHRVRDAQLEVRLKRNKDLRQHHIEEAKILEARIDAERTHRSRKADGAQAYDSIEAELRQEQAKLTSLVQCMRDITRMIQTPVHQGRHAGPIYGAAHAGSLEAPVFGAPNLASPLRIGASPLFGDSL